MRLPRLKLVGNELHRGWICGLAPSDHLGYGKNVSNLQASKGGSLLPPPRAANLDVSDDEGVGARPHRPSKKTAATVDDSDDDQPKTKAARGTACILIQGIIWR